MLREKIESVYRFWTGNSPHPDFTKNILTLFKEHLEKVKDNDWDNEDMKRGWNICLKTIIASLEGE